MNEFKLKFYKNKELYVPKELDKIGTREDFEKFMLLPDNEIPIKNVKMLPYSSDYLSDQDINSINKLIPKEVNK